MTRRTVLGAAGLVWLIVSLSVGRSSAQEPAAVLTDFGWWSRQPGTATPPEAKFSITDAPDGAVSVAAVKIDVQVRKVTKASLVLKEAEGTGGAEVAAIQACPSPSDWQPAYPGEFDDQPKADCTKAVNMTRAGTLWQADIASLLDRTGVVSVSLLPKAGASAGLPVKALWNVVVESMVLEAEGEGPVEGTSTVAPSLADDDTGSSGSIVSSGFEVVTPPSVTSTFRPSTFVPTTPAAPPAVEPALNAPPPPAAAEAPAQSTGTFPRRIDTTAPDERNRRPWVRLVWFLPLAVVAGAGAVFGRRLLQDRGWVAAPGIS